MFKATPSTSQLSMEDPFIHMPAKWQEQLKQGWPEQFYQHIYSQINEERFAVLFSTNASRPNKSVRLIVSLLFLKSLTGASDEELLESLQFDQRYWHALGITSVSDASVSINTLTNFRGRVIDYLEDTGIDLLEQETKSLARAFADVVDLNKKMVRMDSFMISSACRNMTRLELVYAVVAGAAEALDQQDPTAVPESLRPFLEPTHRKEHLYRIADPEVPGKLAWLLQLGEQLHAFLQTREHPAHVKAFALLDRLLKEQTKEVDGKREPKEQGELESDRLQNPSDPDATHRLKGGKGNTGYSCNIVEARDAEKEVGMILEYEIDNNLHSDQAYGETFLQHSPLADEIETLATDGAYHRLESHAIAESKHIEWNVSNIPGRPSTTIGVDQFVRGDDHVITACPEGHAPVKASYDAQTHTYKATFAKATCASCPLLDQCPTQQKKTVASLHFTENKLQTDRARSRLGTERHKELANFRAGVEGVISAVKRGLTQLPIRGLSRAKIWIHGRIMSFNFKSLVRYLGKARNGHPCTIYIPFFCKPYPLRTQISFVCG